MKDQTLRKQIIAALSHPEAEDGLYLNNLIVVHEEEERPLVEGDESVVSRVLEEMIADGEISVSGEGSQRIYSLLQ